MMNSKLALIVSVSAYALQMNPVYASLLSSPPASILDTNIHTTTVQSSALNQSPLNVKHWHDSSFLTASVCFITDTGACSGNSFGGGANTEDGGHGAPGGSGDNGGSGDDSKDPDYELNNAERCKKEGYNLTSCNSVQNPVNKCPYNNSYFEKCVCKSGLVTCTKPQYGVGEACDGKYASCQTDNPRACREDGYTNTCPSGQKLKKSPRCPYDNSYGICCTEKCTNNSSTTCTGANTGDDGCGYSCYKCCDDTCPAYTSKTYKGAYTYTTGCGNRCYKCNCPSGTAPNYSGAAAGSAECGTCYRCSNTCSRGQTSVSCSSKYERVRVGSTECGNSCYECQYNYDCDASRTSCSKPYECNYNSCGICTSCSYNADCDVKGTSCREPYVCEYNSCGICYSCTYNSDCEVSGKSCSHGCSINNSCGKCTKCSSYTCYQDCRLAYETIEGPTNMTVYHFEHETCGTDGEVQTSGCITQKTRAGKPTWCNNLNPLCPW